MKKKVLYISDLDGTLLNKSAQLSEYTKNSLNQMIKDGVCFSVATARTLVTTKMILSDVKLHIPIIVMNGVLIYDTEQKKYIKVNPLSYETAAAVIDALKALNTAGLMYELKNEELITYYESLENKPIRDFIESRKRRYNKSFRNVGSFTDVSQGNIIYFTLLDTYDQIKRIYNKTKELSGINLAMYKDTYSEDLWYLEIFSSEASKQNAVVFLRDTYGFEHITCFGDNLNDLPMFKACDTKVAVKNARDEVKTAADFICETNEDDGVVKWIEKGLSH